jgi:hypothetical protein
MIVYATVPPIASMILIAVGFAFFGKSPFSDHPALLVVIAGVSGIFALLAQAVSTLRDKAEVEMRRKLTEQLRSKVEKSIILLHGKRPLPDSWRSSAELLTKTSTLSAGAATVTSTQEGSEELRSQFGQLAQQVEEHKKLKNEIIEVQKIDPVLETTLKVGLENLTKRIEALEKKQLEKWDVALVTFQVLSGIGVIVGVLFAIMRYMSGR